MKKVIKTLSILVLFFLISCTESTKQDNANISEAAKEEIVDIINSSFSDKNGEKLEIAYNNTKGIATLEFKGEKIKLIQQKSASGNWYKNEHYELIAKGNDIELKKDGNLVFKYEDDIVHSNLKNKSGQTLDMTFNNSTNKVKVYFNGGEQIELVGQNPASGIWYKYENYELRGKGESVKFSKNGKILFEK